MLESLRIFRCLTPTVASDSSDSTKVQQCTGHLSMRCRLSSRQWRRPLVFRVLIIPSPSQKPEFAVAGLPEEIFVESIVNAVSNWYASYYIAVKPTKIPTILTELQVRIPVAFLCPREWRRDRTSDLLVEQKHNVLPMTLVQCKNER